MKDLKDILIEESKKANIKINSMMLEKFDAYATFLIETNKKFNLTNITDSYGIAVKHFLDSIIVLKYIDLKKGAKVVDIGTGAGFPGVPLKIMRPDIELTLIDSLNKRIVFLNELLKNINLKARLIHIRAEEGGKERDLRENFDLAISRAVAKMKILSEFCLPYVKINGLFVAMKGPNIDEELQESQEIINLLGAKQIDLNKFKLPDEEDRTLIKIQKIKRTPDKYPRHISKMNKK